MHAFADNTDQRRRETSCMVSLMVHSPRGVLVPLVSIEAHPACHASSAAATFLDGDFPELIQMSSNNKAHPACHASSAAATFLDGDFPELLQMSSNNNRHACPAQYADLALLSDSDEGGSVCKDCGIVQEVADRHLDVATNQTKPDMGKMCDYLTKYEAHQLHGGV